MNEELNLPLEHSGEATQSTVEKLLMHLTTLTARQTEIVAEHDAATIARFSARQAVIDGRGTTAQVERATGHAAATSDLLREINEQVAAARVSLKQAEDAEAHAHLVARLSAIATQSQKAWCEMQDAKASGARAVEKAANTYYNAYEAHKATRAAFRVELGNRNIKDRDSASVFAEVEATGVPTEGIRSNTDDREFPFDRLIPSPTSRTSFEVALESAALGIKRTKQAQQNHEAERRRKAERDARAAAKKPVTHETRADDVPRFVEVSHAA